MNREQESERHYQAWELRVKGYTYRQIGAELGIGHGTAQRWVEEVWETKSLPLAEKIRTQEFDRMLRYLERLDQQIDDGDLKAIQTAIKISERLCKMTGADMPTVVHVDQPADQLDLAIVDLIASQKARNAIARADAAKKLVESETESIEGESSE